MYGRMQHVFMHFRWMEAGQWPWRLVFLYLFMFFMFIVSIFTTSGVRDLLEGSDSVVWSGHFTLI